jgi:hypothetical protein
MDHGGFLTGSPIWCLDRSKGPAGRSSEFLGDLPPDPRFLASLGILWWAELDHCCVVDLFGGFWTTHDSAPSEARKRGSGGGSPRKSDDRPAGPLDLSDFSNSVQVSQQLERRHRRFVLVSKNDFRSTTVVFVYITMSI